ncbi:unnamed protein product [Notodromas monacha]|uniref:Gamma-glutamyltransferase n=1 Tax=Notodromas monacha TaxID=399045 RepID=A0A7R9BJC4_9CRUS|nr:unnamed protein product [Notodromas monacha]CAG0915705.1 unnamed protein product [Notodromas monacha]
MLERGGSAVDAAIAGLLCNGVVNPQSMGIGGGKAMGIPGEIAGYWEAHLKFGKLPWAELFQPAIELCINGSTVQPPLAKSLQSKKEQILAEPTLRDIFTQPGGKDVLKEGDTMYRQQLGETLQKIAENGANVFYNGSVSKDLLADLSQPDGINSPITAKDLSSYRYSIHSIRRGSKVLHTTNVPSSGPVLGFILNAMKEFYPNKSEIPFGNWSRSDQGLFFHRLTEVYKHAYGRRSFLGDPKFVSDNVDHRQTLNSLGDPRFARFIKSQINDSSTYEDLAYYGARSGATEPRDSGTAHLSVVSPDGVAVAVTSTINTAFGAMFRSTRTGIIMNNEMDDFANPGPNSWGQEALENQQNNNLPEPGKRPMSSMCPSVIVGRDSGQIQAVIGGAGGTKIITAVSQVPTAATVLLLSEIGGMDLLAATEFRRLHHQLLPKEIMFESDFPRDILEELESRGHTTKQYNSFPGSVVVSVHKDINSTWLGVFDPRKLGEVDGID